MKKFGLFFAIALVFLSTNFQGEAKQLQEQPQKEYTILEFEKPSVYNILHNRLDFAVVWTRDGIKHKYYFEVNPSELKIEVRTDKANVTTLKTLSAHEDVFTGVNVYSPVTLLVPNDEDKKLWLDYLEKLGEKYKLEGRVVDNFAFATDGEIYAELATNLQPKWKNDSDDIHFTRVVVKVDDLSLKVDSKRAKDGPVLSVLWPDYYVHQMSDGSYFPLVWAKKLTIYVNEKDSKEWERRIKDWKLKFEPRRVLPPSDD